MHQDSLSYLTEEEIIFPNYSLLPLTANQKFVAILKASNYHHSKILISI
jgi:hypothetical protein